jgi:hypothetical protein
VLYDKAAPVSKPQSGKEYEFFATQREEIRQSVFDEKASQDRLEHVTYWKQLAAGEIKEGV